MIDIDTIYTTLDDVYSRENVLDILVEFERVFDQLDIYVYKNWLKGEIVEGPIIDRYWVTVTLMYPYKMMPDPEGAMRLIDHGCKVWFGEDTLNHVAKITGVESYATNEEGRTTSKLIKSPVWLVKVTMPRHFIDDDQLTKADIDGNNINADDLSDAYDENLNDEDAAKGLATDEQQTQ
jgi:hypothetical protein